MSGIRPGAIVIDVNDLEREARFWTSLLDMEISSSDPDWYDLGRLGSDGPVLSLQAVPEGKAAAKNRLHFDWLVDDFAQVRRRALELGATEASDRHGDERPWQVFRDPEGNEFCLCSA